MDSAPANRRPREAAPLTAHARLERMSEPWALSRIFAIAITMIVAGVFGTWTASSQYEYIAIFAVWVTAGAVIVFVQDYWWAPILIITALAFSTNVAGLPLTGIEMGMMILCLALPTKMAMKTLRKAEPVMMPSVFYWLLLGYVLIHAAVIIAYNHTMGIQLKNIVKAYYTALTPLIFYGLVIRYCHLRTVRTTILILFFVTAWSVAFSIIVMATGITIDFSDLHLAIGWLDSSLANVILRSSSPYLFIFCLAYWPAARDNFGRFFLAIGIFIGFIGTLASGGRLTLATCFVASIFFAVVRGKLWLALPAVALTLLVSTAITMKPDILFNMPESIQRSLAPLNFSDQQTEIQEGLVGSDDWHKNLRDRSLTYWLSDPNSFYFGHGYKSWDTSIVTTEDLSLVDSDRLADLAIEMGLTENMFSSITNIFGLVGLILYACFLIHLGYLLYKGYRLAPAGTMARALCEFSLVNLSTSLAFCALMGSVPGLSLIYWSLGILAARPYLAKQKALPAAAAVAQERPAFARPAYATGPLPSPPRFRPGRA